MNPPDKLSLLTTIRLTVAAAAVAAPVNMASVLNINAMVTDASKFTGSGLDGGLNGALTMAYRDTSMGLRDNRTFLLYECSLTLNASKKLSSITLPNNRNVVVPAMTLTK